MKKLLLLLLCVLPFIGYAQDYSEQPNFVSSPDPSYKGLKPKVKTYLDQVFANAVESLYGRLLVKIDVKKKIKYDDIVAYINEQNAYTTITSMGNNATMTGIRLDPHDPKAIVTTVLFLKKGEYKNYALKHLAKYAQSKMITNGTNADAFIPTFDNQMQLLKQNNVVWNGNSSNGKISGNGQGDHYNNGTIIYFSGSFKDGYPSDCRFYQYTIKEDEIFQRSKVREEGIIVGDFREGLAVFTKPRELYGFINQNGEIVIRQQYTKVVEPFHDGKAVVYDDKRHSNIIINTNGDFVEHEEKYIYENMTKGTASYSQLSSSGKGMFSNYDTFNGTLIDNFKWSGEVVNGMINGNGSGFAKNGKDYYFVKGRFVNGFPNGPIVFQKLNLTSEDLNAVEFPFEYKFEFGERTEGMVFMKYGMYYSLVNEQGKCIALSKYRKVLKPFENGYAEVVRDDDKEIVIDKNGEFVDYTAHQKELDKAEAEAAEQARIAAQNQARIEELNKEWDDLVKKCTEKCMEEWKRTSLVGREVAWEEKITYDISNGNQGLILNLLSSALGQNSVSYTVRYTAILESYIGTTACKVIISRTDIQDPSWASANYLKYRKAAQNDISKNLGQTRVKQLNEIYEQTPVNRRKLKLLVKSSSNYPKEKRLINE